jgi:ribosomal protein S6--L-glutamate ligase
MKIALISQIKSYQIDNLLEQGIKRNHQIDLIKPNKLTVSDPSNDECISKLMEYDYIYYRNGFDHISRYIFTKTFIDKNKLFVNKGYFTSTLLRYKSFQIFQISQNGIKTPITITYQKQNIQTFESLKNKFGEKFIAKVSVGSKGFGVYKIETLEDYQNLPKDNKENRYIYQEYIENDGDYRVFVIGKKVAGIMHRIPKEGDFKANISQGGTGEIVSDKLLVEKLSEIALKVCAILDLDIAGIDIIRSKNDGLLYFIESNSSPQWEGLNKSNGIDIGEEIIKYFESQI